MIDIKEFEKRYGLKASWPTAAKVTKAELLDLTRELKGLRKTVGAVKKTLADAMADLPPRDGNGRAHEYNAEARERLYLAVSVAQAQIDALMPKDDKDDKGENPAPGAP
jgi:hypothetical protein